MTRLICESCGEAFSAKFRPERSELQCDCGGRRKLPSELKPRKPLARVSEKRRAQVQRRGSTLKRGRGMAASPKQRAKVKGAASIISGQGPCDPAHIWPRSLGGCDDPLCVMPLTRVEHEAQEKGELDVLPALLAGGYHAELAHVIEAHKVSPTQLVEHLTGERYIPASVAAADQDRDAEAGERHAF